MTEAEENTPGLLQQKAAMVGVWEQRADQGISESSERLRARCTGPSLGQRIGASFTGIDQIPGGHFRNLHIPVGLLSAFW